MLFTINFYQYLQPPILLSQSIVLSMKKALNKSEAIQKAVEAYKNDDTLSMRAAARFYGCSDKSIANYLNGKIKPAPDCFVSY